MPPIALFGLMHLKVALPILVLGGAGGSLCSPLSGELLSTPEGALATPAQIALQAAGHAVFNDMRALTAGAARRGLRLDGANTRISPL